MNHIINYLHMFTDPTTKAHDIDTTAVSGIILDMGSANERQCYNVKLSLIGWAYTQNDPCVLW